jgi:hypothetical protein
VAYITQVAVGRKFLISKYISSDKEKVADVNKCIVLLYLVIY